jgi:acyl-CoA synthetase (AMP-forming)/AMP-acid ligase II
VIDESSGTSGRPNNWVRGPEERADVRKLLQLDLRQVFGTEPLFVVNAFALGPWATGMAVSMATVDVAVLKSVGPDVGKIDSTLRQFGPHYRYLVLGYPPFLKQLVDEARIDWSEYDCAAVVGGEGMSEALRSYLLRRFRAVYSSFGAADLEINIAAENDFTIALRRLLAERPELGHALNLPSHSSLPMVFQYNPLDYVIETSDAGELVISICRVETTAPKLRYNLHDLGCVVRFREVERALAELEMRPADLAERRLDLPLLFHYGRSDATVAFYGAKVAPTDVEEVVLAARTRRAGALVRPAPRRGRGGQQDPHLRLRTRSRRPSAGGRRGNAGAVPRSPVQGEPGLPRGGPLHPSGQGAHSRVPRAGRRAVRGLRRTAQAQVRAVAGMSREGGRPVASRRFSRPGRRRRSGRARRRGVEPDP